MSDLHHEIEAKQRWKSKSCLVNLHVVEAAVSSTVHLFVGENALHLCTCSMSARQINEDFELIYPVNHDEA